MVAVTRQKAPARRVCQCGLKVCRIRAKTEGWFRTGYKLARAGETRRMICHDAIASRQRGIGAVRVEPEGWFHTGTTRRERGERGDKAFQITF